MNKDDTKSSIDIADENRPGKTYPNDGLGYLKIEHTDWALPKPPTPPSYLEPSVVVPAAEIQPEIKVPESKEVVSVTTPTSAPEDIPERMEAIDTTVATNPSEVIESSEPTLSAQDETILPIDTDAPPTLAPVTPKKNKRQTAILVAASIVLLLSSGVSAWRFLDSKETVAYQGEESSQTATDESETDATVPTDDDTTKEPSEEQKPESREETTPPVVEVVTPVKPVVTKPPVVVEKPTQPVEPEEPTPPAPQFKRGTMTLDEDDDVVQWHYTGNAIYGYKLVYNIQTIYPTVENHPYISFGMNETSFSLPTNRLPKGVHIARVCAYTANTSGEMCVDYSDYLVIKNY